MEFEVVVVGGGIGGLTTAALLAARGFNVALFERQSSVGGCVRSFEHLGYKFEPTYGLYSGWEPGGVFQNIFSELGIAAPPVEALSPSYIVRLPDGANIAISNDAEEFNAQLRAAFPECAPDAINFYSRLKAAGGPKIERLSKLLAQCSLRFRRFVDVQLQTFAQCASDICPADRAAVELNPSRRFWRIGGGIESVANLLAESFKANGGSLKLNSPVLRLNFSPAGQPAGIDLLSGERVTATRAIVSNLTVWDTFGKLVGLSRAPREVGQTLRQLEAWGTYQMFLAIETSTTNQFDSTRLIALTDWQENEVFDPEAGHFVFAGSQIIPMDGSETQTATVSMPVRAEEWFSFHQDHSAHEVQDQATLENLWSRLHIAMPELGNRAEIIETATPQTFYETTRRKFGFVGGLAAGAPLPTSLAQPFPNLFLVGDTVANGFGLAATAHQALAVLGAIAQN